MGFSSYRGDCRHRGVTHLREGRQCLAGQRDKPVIFDPASATEQPAKWQQTAQPQSGGEQMRRLIDLVADADPPASTRGMADPAEARQRQCRKGQGERVSVRRDTGAEQQQRGEQQVPTPHPAESRRGQDLNDGRRIERLARFASHQSRDTGDDR